MSKYGDLLVTIPLDKSINTLVRKTRSKWYHLACQGPKRHYRKDGSCQHTDELLASLKPEIRARTRVDGWGGKG